MKKYFLIYESTTQEIVLNKIIIRRFYCILLRFYTSYISLKPVLGKNNRKKNIVSSRALWIKNISVRTNYKVQILIKRFV